MSDPKHGGGGMGMNVVTTVMAFSVSAFFVLFVFTRLLCARLRLSRAAAAGDAFVVQGYNVERGINGLEPSVLRTFPTVKLGDGGGQQPPPVQEESQLRLTLEHSQSEINIGRWPSAVHKYFLSSKFCTVCLEEYEAKDVVRVLPACGHAFHAACIDAWLRQHPTCPVCRASLRATKNNAGRAAMPLDYSFLVAAAAARGGPVAAQQQQQQAPASSSDDLGAPPQAAGHQHQAGHDGLLEIVTEEPASSGVVSPAADADAARQSHGSAGASQHQHC